MRTSAAALNLRGGLDAHARYTLPLDRGCAPVLPDAEPTDPEPSACEGASASDVAPGGAGGGSSEGRGVRLPTPRRPKKPVGALVPPSEPPLLVRLRSRVRVRSVLAREMRSAMVRGVAAPPTDAIDC